MAGTPVTVYPGCAPYPAAEKARRIEAIAAQSEIVRFMGMRFTDLEPGGCRIELPVRPAFLNGRGVVHGGVVATLADTAIAYSVHGALPPQARTASIELKINFVRPVSEGTLVALGRLVNLGRRTAVVEADVLTPAGKLAARCLSTVMISAPAEGA